MVGSLRLTQFFLNLELKFIAGASKLAHEPTQLFGYLRQLLWPKDDKGQHEDKNAVR